MISLLQQKPFAKGGKRQIYVHPDDEEKCIKIWLPGCEPQTLKKQAKLSKRLRKSVRSFDENRNDWETLRQLEKKEGPQVWAHIPKCYGYTETDLGPGLVFELLKDHNGLISRSILDLLWESGEREKFAAAIDDFKKFWHEYPVPSRQLDLYNISAQEVAPGKYRLVLIDGFGETILIPNFLLPRAMIKKRAERKVERFEERIEKLLNRKKNGGRPGSLGFLDARE